jgi:hypothetical protein
VRIPSMRQFGLDRQRANATLGPAASTALVLQTAALPLARWLDWSPDAGQPANVTTGLWLLLTRTGRPTDGDVDDAVVTRAFGRDTRGRAPGAGSRACGSP